MKTTQNPKIEDKSPSGVGEERTFNLVVDDVPYLITAAPFQFNDETRFYIRINGGADHTFTWDSSVGRLRAIDDSSSIIPDALEQAISQKLQAFMR